MCQRNAHPLAKDFLSRVSTSSPTPASITTDVQESRQVWDAQLLDKADVFFASFPVEMEGVLVLGLVAKTGRTPWVLAPEPDGARLAAQVNAAARGLAHTISQSVVWTTARVPSIGGSSCSSTHEVQGVQMVFALGFGNATLFYDATLVQVTAGQIMLFNRAALSKVALAGMVSLIILSSECDVSEVAPTIRKTGRLGVSG